MTPGLISVIVPCYNQGIYLKETIQSALASTYRPLEIIIILVALAGVVLIHDFYRKFFND